MNLRTDFTHPECEHFRANCNFTAAERLIFDKRVSDKSIIEICFELNMSESTVHRKIKNIKSKILRVL